VDDEGMDISALLKKLDKLAEKKTWFIYIIPDFKTLQHYHEP
jgi:hypothetical protein